MSHPSEPTSWAAKVHESYQAQLAADVFPPVLGDELLWDTPGVDEADRDSEQQLAEFNLCTITNPRMHPGVILWPLVEGEPKHMDDNEYREIMEPYLEKNGFGSQSIDFVIKSASQQERRAGTTLYEIRKLIELNKRFY